MRHLEWTGHIPPDRNTYLVHINEDCRDEWLWAWYVGIEEHIYGGFESET